MTDHAKLNVYNTEWEKIAYIDSYTSLIWTRRYTTYGDFELYMPWKPYLNDIIKPDYYIELDGDPDLRGVWGSEIYAMIIERIEYVQETGQPTMVIVKGRDLESILHRRVFYNDIVLSDSTTGYSLSCRYNYLAYIIKNCMGIDAVPARRIPYSIFNVNIPMPQYDDSRVRTVNKNDNLGESIAELLSTWGYGILVTYNLSDEMLYIRFSEHADRTTGENALIFRSDLDNLANCHYIKDISGMGNVCRISSNENTATYPPGQNFDTATFRGINRREVAFTTDLLGAATGTYQALQASGQRQIRSYYTTEDITAEIITTADIDYKLGDLALIETDFGVMSQAWITEITQSYSSEGYIKYPTFGTFKTLDDVRRNGEE